MLSEDGVVFPEGEFVGAVHRVFLGIVSADAGTFGNEANEFAFGGSFLCHVVYCSIYMCVGLGFTESAY